MMKWTFVIGLIISLSLVEGRKVWPPRSKSNSTRKPGFPVKLISQDPLIYRLELPNNKSYKKQSGPAGPNNLLESETQAKNLPIATVRKKRCHNHESHLKMKRNTPPVEDMEVFHETTTELSEETPIYEEMNYLPEMSPYNYTLLNTADRPIIHSENRRSPRHDSSADNPATVTNHVTPREAPYEPINQKTPANSVEEYKIVDMSQPSGKDFETLKNYLSTVHERQLESHKRYQNQFSDNLEADKTPKYYKNPVDPKIDSYYPQIKTHWSNDAPIGGRYPSPHGENYNHDDASKIRSPYYPAPMSPLGLPNDNSHVYASDMENFPADIASYLDPKKLYYEALNSLISEQLPKNKSTKPQEDNLANNRHAPQEQVSVMNKTVGENAPVPNIAIKPIQAGEKHDPNLSRANVPIMNNPQSQGLQSSIHKQEANTGFNQPIIEMEGNHKSPVVNPAYVTNPANDQVKNFQNSPVANTAYDVYTPNVRVVNPAFSTNPASLKVENYQNTPVDNSRSVNNHHTPRVGHHHNLPEVNPTLSTNPTSVKEETYQNTPVVSSASAINQYAARGLVQHHHNSPEVNLAYSTNPARINVENYQNTPVVNSASIIQHSHGVDVEHRHSSPEVNPAYSNNPASVKVDNYQNTPVVYSESVMNQHAHRVGVEHAHNSPKVKPTHSTNPASVKAENYQNTPVVNSASAINQHTLRVGVGHHNSPGVNPQSSINPASVKIENHQNTAVVNAASAIHQNRPREVVENDHSLPEVNQPFSTNPASIINYQNLPEGNSGSVDYQPSKGLVYHHNLSMVNHAADSNEKNYHNLPVVNAAYVTQQDVSSAGVDNRQELPMVNTAYIGDQEKHVVRSQPDYGINHHKGSQVVEMSQNMPMVKATLDDAGIPVGVAEPTSGINTYHQAQKVSQSFKTSAKSKPDVYEMPPRIDNSSQQSFKQQPGVIASDEEIVKRPNHESINYKEVPTDEKKEELRPTENDREQEPRLNIPRTPNIPESSNKESKNSPSIDAISKPTNYNPELWINSPQTHGGYDYQSMRRRNFDRIENTPELRLREKDSQLAYPPVGKNVAVLSNMQNNSPNTKTAGLPKDSGNFYSEETREKHPIIDENHEMDQIAEDQHTNKQDVESFTHEPRTKSPSIDNIPVLHQETSATVPIVRPITENGLDNAANTRNSSTRKLRPNKYLGTQTILKSVSPTSPAKSQKMPTRPSNIGNVSNIRQHVPGINIKNSEIIKKIERKLDPFGRSQIPPEQNDPESDKNPKSFHQDLRLTSKEIEFYNQPSPNIILMDHIPANIPDDSKVSKPVTLKIPVESSNGHFPNQQEKPLNFIMPDIPKTQENEEIKNTKIPQILQQIPPHIVSLPEGGDKNKSPLHKNHEIASTQNTADSPIIEFIPDKSNIEQKQTRRDFDEIKILESQRDPNDQSEYSGKTSEHSFPRIYRVDDGTKMPSYRNLEENEDNSKPVVEAVYAPSVDERFKVEEQPEKEESYIIRKTVGKPLKDSLARKNKEKGRVNKRKSIKKYLTKSSTIPIPVQKLLLQFVPKNSQHLAPTAVVYATEPMEETTTEGQEIDGNKRNETMFPPDTKTEAEVLPRKEHEKTEVILRTKSTNIPKEMPINERKELSSDESPLPRKEIEKTEMLLRTKSTNIPEEMPINGRKELSSDEGPLAEKEIEKTKVLLRAQSTNIPKEMPTTERKELSSDKIPLPRKELEETDVLLNPKNTNIPKEHKELFSNKEEKEIEHGKNSAKPSTIAVPYIEKLSSTMENEDTSKQITKEKSHHHIKLDTEVSSPDHSNPNKAAKSSTTEESLDKTVADEILELQKTYLDNLPINISNRGYGFYPSNNHQIEKNPSYSVVLDEGNKGVSSETVDEKSNPEYPIQYLRGLIKPGEGYQIVEDSPEPKDTKNTTTAAGDKGDYRVMIGPETTNSEEDKVKNLVSLIRNLSSKNESEDRQEMNSGKVDLLPTDETEKPVVLDGLGAADTGKLEIDNVDIANLSPPISSNTAMEILPVENKKNKDLGRQIDVILGDHLRNNTEGNDPILTDVKENAEVGSQKLHTKNGEDVKPDDTTISQYDEEADNRENEERMKTTLAQKKLDTTAKKSRPSIRRKDSSLKATKQEIKPMALDSIMEQLKKIIIPFDPKSPQPKIIFIDPNQFNQKSVKVIEIPDKMKKHNSRQFDPFENDELAKSSPDTESSENYESSKENYEEDYANGNSSEEEDENPPRITLPSKAIKIQTTTEKVKIIPKFQFPNIKEQIKWSKLSNSGIKPGNFDRLIFQRSATSGYNQSEGTLLNPKSNKILSSLQQKLAQQREDRRLAAEARSQMLKDFGKTSSLMEQPKLQSAAEGAHQNVDLPSTGFSGSSAAQNTTEQASAKKVVDTPSAASFDSKNAQQISQIPMGSFHFQTPNETPIDATDSATLNGFNQMNISPDLLENNPSNEQMEIIHKRSCSCGNHTGVMIGNTCKCSMINSPTENFIKDSEIQSNADNNSKVFKEIQSRIANQRKVFNENKNLIKSKGAGILEKQKKPTKCALCKDCSSASFESGEAILGEKKQEGCGCGHNEIQIVKVRSDKLKAMQKQQNGCNCGKDGGCNHNEILKASAPPKDDTNKYDILNNVLLYLKQYAPKEH